MRSALRLSQQCFRALPRAVRPPAVRALPARTLVSVRKPTIAEAVAMPRAVHEYPSDVLLIMAEAGDWDACKERLIREIMAVDEVEYDEAEEVFQAINRKNSSGTFFAALPYRVGIFTALVCGFGSLPMVFHYETAYSFNDAFVTTEVPPKEDLETWLEVGLWSWGWMEPPLGQASFLLLCLQYSRAQLDNMNIKPYTAWIKDARASRLSRKYSKYNAKIVEDFARADFLLHRE